MLAGSGTACGSNANSADHDGASPPGEACMPDRLCVKNPLPTIKSGKFDEVQKYLVLSGHIITPRLVVVNEAFWQGLSAADRRLLEDAIRAGIAWQDDELAKQEKALVDQVLGLRTDLRAKHHKVEGTASSLEARTDKEVGGQSPERQALLDGSLVAGVYEKVVDRVSAHEELAQRTAGALGAAPAPGQAAGAPTAEAPAEGGGLMGELGKMVFGSTGPRGGRREGLAESMAKSAVHSIGSAVGREIIRGVLGGIIGGRRR